jgi:hypothetical protein
MNFEELLLLLLEPFNETLTAAVVIVAVSLLLYNLSRNLNDRVARTSSVVLACVTVAYVADVFVSLNPSLAVYESVLRLQWIGIAFIPAATFHLSDALLATTGLPSRGRRRRVTRILYAISLTFLVAALATDILVQPLREPSSVGLRAGPLFPVYVLFFLLATGIAFINVQRARQRCLTRDTRRRMGYLQFSLLTPVIGIFPFSVLLGPGEEFTLGAQLLVNATNIIIILMLLFLAYPLSFFGSRVPDRVVKTELLRFILRGPATGLIALAVIIFTTPATRVLGLSGETFMPFAVVAFVLLWQWSVALSLPWLEKRLIYPNEDDYQLSKLQNLSEQLLTQSDLFQMLEAILAAVCDYLQVSTAFTVSLETEEPEIVCAIGPSRPDASLLATDADRITQLLAPNDDDDDALHIEHWHSYWIVPLYSKRRSEPGQRQVLIGFIGIKARAPEINLTEEERETFTSFVMRAAQAIDDLALQAEIYAALEGLLPQISMTRTRAADVEFRIGRRSLRTNGVVKAPAPLQDDRDQFVEQVRAALRHYWGGPGLTHSRLLELSIVNEHLDDNGDNPVHALRAVLAEAIDSQRPDGDRKLLSPEWMIYNILSLRFVERQKVRDVAHRLALSEPDLYRKQRVAIEAVADKIIEMENTHTK